MRVLTLLYLGVCVTMFAVATLPPLALATPLLFLAMGLLGMGNGAVFQLVGVRFAREIGVISGIVGAAGGVGGFFLPNFLGTLKQLTGTFAGGYVLFALVSLGSAFALVRLSRIWQRAFLVPDGSAVPAESALENAANVVAPVEISG
jgi:NNP family nitrate/nitrite transporter-like MFS transporter